MALDHDPVQSKEHPAIGLVRIQLVAQFPECISRKEVADPGAPGARQRGAQKLVDLARRALGGLQSNVAAKSFGDDHVGRALADAIALDEADIIELRQVHRAQQFGRLADLLVALDLLDPDIEQADGRPLEVEQHACHRAAHHCHLHQMTRVAADGGAEIEHD